MNDRTELSLPRVGDETTLCTIQTQVLMFTGFARSAEAFLESLLGRGTMVNYIGDILAL
jgi:hypothetical protein